MKMFAIHYLLVAAFPALSGDVPNYEAVMFRSASECQKISRQWSQTPGVEIIYDCKPTNGHETIRIIPGRPA